MKADAVLLWTGIALYAAAAVEVGIELLRTPAGYHFSAGYWVYALAASLPIWAAVVVGRWIARVRRARVSASSRGAVSP
jgi:hypothetical protein